ncbi:T6SS phospholipase effector Tle1-like catalytic domain-containing protein [Paraburkholderia nemoris]|uniref:T6SS phospholipase effector Tle1-like catalytic domain-containing protein n=1 Tax=Paraburkholderia nemoris TaxID=2793076 RepID=UPI001B171DC9|nr:DUF2235 domain-containing protein [Paraburkholderia nemoris]CAE6792356.1 hypothetical protein LMG22931_05015 [Paraburkholderia nemoris]
MLDNTQPPCPAGVRPLTLQERKQRADAMACLDNGTKPGASDCSQNIWISIFFDGTGNNLLHDTPREKQSNVSRLWAAHAADDDAASTYRIYLPGLGTPYPAIGENGESAMGLGFAAGGEKRLQRARIEFDRHVKSAAARAKNPTQPVRMINLALFGFSRGAALARAFAVRIAAECQSKDGCWRYQDYPIRLYFMGLFDTVASAGLSGGAKVLDHSPIVRTALGAVWPLAGIGLASAPKDGHYDWAKDLRIPPMAEQCVHFVAAHEVRDSFPLDSVRNGKHYPANTVETIYPGVHSDVGGGYAPGEQTRALKDEEKLSQIPLQHMYRIARVAGVPLRALETLGSEVTASFNCAARTAALYDKYQQLTQASGPVEQAFSDHQFQLYRARSYLSKLENDNAAQARVPAAETALMQTNNADLVPTVKPQLAIVTANGNAVNQATANAETRKIEGKALSLREATLARAYEDVSLITGPQEDKQALLDFFDYLVHDSVAGFGKDFSKLENWRMMYFADVAYVPANDWSLSGPAAPI